MPAGQFIRRTRLTKAVRTNDVVARYGGEEFVVLLPAVSSGGLSRLAERLRWLIADQPFSIDGATRLDVTVSVGLALSPDHAQTSDALISVADQGLYRAKARGRNQVSTPVSTPL